MTCLILRHVNEGLRKITTILIKSHDSDQITQTTKQPNNQTKKQRNNETKKQKKERKRRQKDRKKAAMDSAKGIFTLNNNSLRHNSTYSTYFHHQKSSKYTILLIFLQFSLQPVQSWACNQRPAAQNWLFIAQPQPEMVPWVYDS